VARESAVPAGCKVITDPAVSLIEPEATPRRPTGRAPPRLGAWDFTRSTPPRTQAAMGWIGSRAIRAGCRDRAETRNATVAVAEPRR